MTDENKKSLKEYEKEILKKLDDSKEIIDKLISIVTSDNGDEFDKEMTIDSLQYHIDNLNYIHKSVKEDIERYLEENDK